jgi:hypothetical protein
MGRTVEQPSLRAQAKQSIVEAAKRKPDCFVASLLAMTSRYDFAISPPVSREVCQEFSPSERSEGVGNAGCPMHPQPRV